MPGVGYHNTHPVVLREPSWGAIRSGVFRTLRAGLTIIIVRGNHARAGADRNTRSAHLLAIFSGLGWTGFWAFFLSRLAAIDGRAALVRHKRAKFAPQAKLARYLAKGIRLQP
jgi:hypothetical protein